MKNVALPDVNDLESVIADYFDSMFPEMNLTTERENIIARCIKPFAHLVSTWEIVHANGKIEEQILTAFMRDVFSMRERCRSSDFEQMCAHNLH